MVASFSPIFHTKFEATKAVLCAVMCIFRNNILSILPAAQNSLRYSHSVNQFKNDVIDEPFLDFPLGLCHFLAFNNNKLK